MYIHLIDIGMHTKTPPPTPPLDEIIIHCKHTPRTSLSHQRKKREKHHAGLKNPSKGCAIHWTYIISHAEGASERERERETNQDLTNDGDWSFADVSYSLALSVYIAHYKQKYKL